MNDNVIITANTPTINIGVVPNTNDVEVTTLPQYVTVEVGSTLTTSSGNFVVAETPSGAINGTNATFTTAQSFDPDTVACFVNGIQATKNIDYTTSGTNTINFTYSLATGDILRVNYKV